MDWLFAHEPDEFPYPAGRSRASCRPDVGGYSAGDVPSHPAATNRVQKPAGVVFAIQDNRMST